VNYFYGHYKKYFVIQHKFYSTHVDVKSFIVAFYEKRELLYRSIISQILVNSKFVLVSSTAPICVVTLINFMKHKYELLLENYKVRNVLPICVHIYSG
jgi:hypothetical protein